MDRQADVTTRRMVWAVDNKDEDGWTGQGNDGSELAWPLAKPHHASKVTGYALPRQQAGIAFGCTLPCQGGDIAPGYASPGQQASIAYGYALPCF